MSDDVVVGLDGEPAGAADPDIVALASSLLRAAKAGQINSIAVAYTTRGGELCTTWWWTEDGDWLSMVGGVAMLQQELGKYAGEDEE